MTKTSYIYAKSLFCNLKIHYLCSQDIELADHTRLRLYGRDKNGINHYLYFLGIKLA